MIIQKEFGGFDGTNERLDEKKSCTIGSCLDDVNIINLDDWQKIKDFSVMLCLDWIKHSVHWFRKWQKKYRRFGVVI